MRPGQSNKRGRGRGGRKGPSPLSRSYESNGPDVKIRGTAQHIADKYINLARDAQSSGDTVLSEAYFQHAEHFYRIVAAAQQQMNQAVNVKRADDPIDTDDSDDRDGKDGFDPSDPDAPQPEAGANGSGQNRNENRRDRNRDDDDDGDRRSRRNRGRQRRGRGDDDRGDETRADARSEGVVVTTPGVTTMVLAETAIRAATAMGPIARAKMPMRRLNLQQCRQMKAAPATVHPVTATSGHAARRASARPVWKSPIVSTVRKRRPVARLRLKASLLLRRLSRYL